MKKIALILCACSVLFSGITANAKIIPGESVSITYDFEDGDSQKFKVTEIHDGDVAAIMKDDGIEDGTNAIKLVKGNEVGFVRIEIEVPEAVKDAEELSVSYDIRVEDFSDDNHAVTASKMAGRFPEIQDEKGNSLLKYRTYSPWLALSDGSGGLNLLPYDTAGNYTDYMSEKYWTFKNVIRLKENCYDCIGSTLWVSGESEKRFNRKLLTAKTGDKVDKLVFEVETRYGASGKETIIWLDNFKFEAQKPNPYRVTEVEIKKEGGAAAVSGNIVNRNTGSETYAIVCGLYDTKGIMTDVAYLTGVVDGGADPVPFKFEFDNFTQGSIAKLYCWDGIPTGKRFGEAIALQ